MTGVQTCALPIYRAKCGIFIHWGPYCVPGCGNSNPWEVYAEWYWWYGHHRIADRTDVYNHQLNTYGPSLVCDHFFSNFTAKNWDAKSWVNLIADAGAQYFVLTTKHQNVFALYDTKATTCRSSLHCGPRRDILNELFDAAKKYQPHLRRGTYFSLPEWVSTLRSIHLPFCFRDWISVGHPLLELIPDA